MLRTPDRFFPKAVPDVVGMAAALVDRSRAAMCAALMDGRVWTVDKLSSYAGVARSTTSEHVDMLEAHGLITRAQQGRHCYVIISGPEAARAVEALGAMSASVLSTAHSLNAQTANKRLLVACACYRHLAGRLGVSLAKHLQERGHLDPSWRLTDSGGDLLATWGLGKPRRARGRACMNFTERQFHLGGPLGTALTQAFFDRALTTRVGWSRAVKATTVGCEALAQTGLTDVLILFDEMTPNNVTG